MSDPNSSRIKNFPVAWFAVVMGLSGFTIAWAKAESVLSTGFHVSQYLVWLTTAVFVVLALLFTVKALRYPMEVVGEIKHPVKLAFVPTISIGLILLAIVFLHRAPAASSWLWMVGTALHLVITLYVLSSWIHHDKYQIAHLNPAWFIPVVGNILIPVAGVHHATPEISWFFFSIGLFFWPVLTAIIFYRLIFHGSLPERFMPTLFIFIAPPAVGFIAYFNLVGGIDAFARVLYGVGLFFTLLLLAQASYFVRLKFFLSWWAYSFPLAAITIATFIMAQATGAAGYRQLGIALLALLTIAIVGLAARTLLAVVRHEICVEGH